MLSAEEQRLAAKASIEDVTREILALREIKEPAGLVEAVLEVLRKFGAEVFSFQSCFRDGDNEVYRYLIGCPPQLCQEYNARRWREIDPVFTYATHHMRPALSRDFLSLSPGQQELMEAARMIGFNSCIGIPVRHAGDSRSGVLHIGSSKSDADDELYLAQGVFMHLATELLDWVVRRVRDQELGEIKLDALDQYILRYHYQGFTADQIADLCDAPLARVRNRMRRLNEKFHTNSQKDAVNRAIEMGLLKLHECIES